MLKRWIADPKDARDGVKKISGSLFQMAYNYGILGNQASLINDAGKLAAKIYIFNTLQKKQL